MTPWTGTLFRVCDPLYANRRDLLTGDGSRLYGGRWNAPASFAAVYLAQTMDGAIAESIGVVTHYGFDPADRLPLTVVAVDASMRQALDLTGVSLRRRMRLMISAMTGCDWRRENAADRLPPPS